MVDTDDDEFVCAYDAAISYAENKRAWSARKAEEISQAVGIEC